MLIDFLEENFGAARIRGIVYGNEAMKNEHFNIRKFHNL